MSLSIAYNEPSYTPDEVLASNVKRYNRRLKSSRKIACAGPGHHQVNVHHRRKYYAGHGFSVVFVSPGAFSVPKSYTKLALLCNGHGMDLLLEDHSSAFEAARTSAAAQGKTMFEVAGAACDVGKDQAVTSFKRLSVCLYEAFREMFQPYKPKAEAVIEFSDGKCVVAAKDSMIFLRNCDVTRITVRLQSVVCRTLHTLDELKLAAATGMYTLFARKVAIDGARKVMYSVLFFRNVKGFVCQKCGHHCRSLREAVAHAGDEGRMSSFQKVVIGLNGSIALRETAPSDFNIYDSYFTEYSQPVNAEMLREALNARPHKRPRKTEIP